MNAFDQMTQAVEEAKTTLRAADNVATQMARMLDGRLRSVESHYALSNLKNELRDYNIHTGEWK